MSVSRNEVKTRMSDEVYAALVEIRRAYGFDSDSVALAFVAERGLLGMVRTVPPALVDRSPVPGRMAA